MRKGTNISKDILLPKTDSYHRVIIPLFIPEEEEYYKDAFAIFNYCIKSIRKTSCSVIKISVVSNGSSDAVNLKLLKMQQENLIDDLIVIKENIGKINSILKALRTSQERLITITDADVLFDNDWEKEVLKIFEAFPKAGSVSPVPVFRNHFRLTSNIWLAYLFSSKLKFRPVKDPEGMTLFANSIGWPWLDNKYKDVIATLKSKKEVVAVLGSSHFVCTYKREIFTKMPEKNSIYRLGGDSEYLYTDLPVIKAGGYRLATYGNFAYHLGNVAEEWMTEKYNQLKDADKQQAGEIQLQVLKSIPFLNIFIEKVFGKILKQKAFRRFVLKRKGLTDKQLSDFNQ